MSETVQKTKISDLHAGMQNVSVVGNVVSVQKKELKNDRGESVYYYGILGDETGTISFTAWMFPSTVRAGDTIEIKRCSVKEYKGVNRLYIDSNSEVIMRPGESIQVKRSYSQLKVREISTSQPFVTVEGKISNVRQKELERDGKKTQMYYADFDDDTGRIRISSFDRPLKDGEYLRLEGAKVSEYNGRFRLTIGNRTSVTEIKPNFTVGERIYDIREITSPLGGIRVSGFVVSLGEKSGLVMRCSACNQRLDDLHCPDHPEAPISYDIFAYFTIDDGTGSIQCTGGKSVFLKELGFTEAQFAPANKSITRRSVFTGLQEKILGKVIVGSGDVSRNQAGLSIRLNDISHLGEDFLKKLVERMEADFQ